MILGTVLDEILTITKQFKAYSVTLPPSKA
jgi:hypothetical protein